MHRLLALGPLVLAGCTLYFNGGDDVCEGWAVDVAPQLQLRDPATGECQGFGGGGGGCDTGCGPCAEVARTSPVPTPDWGQCFSACEGLEQNDCAATTGCRVAFLRDNVTDGPPRFFGCWQIAPSGPAHGTCRGLDAQDCSEHDDCSALYGEGIEGGTFFVECTTESGIDACSNVDCGQGSHCEQQCATPPDAPGGSCQPMCVPDQDACLVLDCGPGQECVEVCDPPPPGCEPGTPGTCHPACRPTQSCESSAGEAECVAKACTPVYLGEDCTCTPAGCTCEIQTYDRCESK